VVNSQRKSPGTGLALRAFRESDLHNQTAQARCLPDQSESANLSYI